MYCCPSCVAVVLRQRCIKHAVQHPYPDSRPVSFCTAAQSLAALARLNGTRPPQEPLALPPAQPAATKGPAGQPIAKKQGLGSALGNIHIARRFFILAYAFLVMCMVRRGGNGVCVGARGSLKACNVLT